MVSWQSIVEEEARAGAPTPSPESTVDRLISKTPWWGLSLGLHVLFALLAGWFWVAAARPEDEAVVVSPPRRPRPMPELDRPRDPHENRKILDMEKKVEDPVFKKDAEESDRNETADEQEFQKARGDALDFLTDKPFKGKATYDVIGAGAGGGGHYGTRFGGKRNLVARGGGGGETEGAVLEALKWLSRHQADDGSWKSRGHDRECGMLAKYPGKCSPASGRDTSDAGVTGLALLAFLGAGYSHLSRDTYDGICFGEVVRKAIQWMLRQQDAEGCIGARQGHYMYNHLIAALALTEAYGLTGSHLFKDQAQRAVDFTVGAQNPGMGWRYTYRSRDNDTSVTGWAVMVLKSAELSDLKFPESAYKGTRAWLDSVTDGSYGLVGYTHKSQGDERKAMTAVGVMSRIFMDRNHADPRLATGCDFLLRHKPAWQGREIDFYYWYYASLALFQFDGPEGPKWRAWNEPMKVALVKNQNPRSTGCKAGSWEPADRWSSAGGRVYATALNALTLEVYYRYANVFGAR